jgi:NAD(P) transhydrogenase subunit alpha
MTAAGTVKPARVVVMGAGVAGLQAVATARRLGAVVEVSDIRPAVAEEVHSLGGRFIELPMQESGAGQGGYAKQMGEDFLRRQREIVQKHLAAADVAITTAQIPGRRAPTLITREMVEAMRRGAIIIDLAAEQGGNCELTRLGEEVEHQGVTILGPANLAATLSEDASALYARNLLALTRAMVSDGKIEIDPADEVLGPTLWTHGGAVVHAPTAERLGLAAPAAAPSAPPQEAVTTAERS